MADVVAVVVVHKVGDERAKPINPRQSQSLHSMSSLGM